MWPVVALMDSPVGLQAEKERSFSHSIDLLLQTKELDNEELEIVFYTCCYHVFKNDKSFSNVELKMCYAPTQSLPLVRSKKPCRLKYETKLFIKI